MSRDVTLWTGRKGSRGRGRAGWKGCRAQPDNACRWPDGAAPGCRSRKRNAHVTERRVILYRWHPWHGRDVLITGMTVRAGSVLLRCRAEDDSGRSVEVPEWMFDTATCCGTRLEPAPAVTCAALQAVRELLETVERVSATPVLQAEHLHPEGVAYAVQTTAVLERSTAAISTHSACALERDIGRDACSNSDAIGASAAPAYSSPPGSEVAS
jgi:hypothetical protein